MLRHDFIPEICILPNVILLISSILFMKRFITLLLMVSSSQAVSAQLQNRTMESWRNYTSGFPLSNKQLEAPNGWYGLDSLVMWGISFLKFTTGGGTPTLYRQVFKSTESHSGTYAARIITRPQDTLGMVPGVLSNAQVSVDLAAITGGGNMTDALKYTGGTSVAGRVTQVSAWLKYLPKGNDTATFTAFTVLSGQGAGGEDSVVGMGTMLVNATSAYTEVTVPLLYIDSSVVPDKLIIGFTSSAGISGSDSSMLYIDDVSMQVTAGISQPLMEKRIAACYPNPSRGLVMLQATIQAPLQWTIFDATGKVIHIQTFTQSAEADLSGQAAGLYFYNIHDNLGKKQQTGKFTLIK